MKNEKWKKDEGREYTKIRHRECVQCKKYSDPHIGLIPKKCKDRFHPIVLADCKNEKKGGGKKEKFRAKYHVHPLTPINIMNNGCPEYEAIE